MVSVLAYSLYWFLKVEADSDPVPQRKKMYTDVHEIFVSLLDPEVSGCLDRQSIFLSKVLESQSRASEKGGNRDVRQKEMSRILREETVFTGIIR